MVESKASASLFQFYPSKGPQLTYRPLRLVSQGTPITGRIMDIDHGSRTSVVSRLSGPGQVGEI